MNHNLPLIYYQFGDYRISRDKTSPYLFLGIGEDDCRGIINEDDDPVIGDLMHEIIRLVQERNGPKE